MKKHIYIILLLLGLTGAYAQVPPPPPIIAINDAGDAQSLFDPEQLIEDVLIDSPCSVVSDFTYQVSGNPGDTNTKSYGYFKRAGGSTFPFEEGIVISSGQANPGGNIVTGGLVNYQNGLPGDGDLDNAIVSTPGTLSNDATFIKFTFTPLADNISFRFLMASEEYGDFECQYTDSFAFLLREVGTIAYTNLAILPDGTEVTVTNINNNQAPAPDNCNSNPQYFAGYNPAIRDTNYGGRTIALTATADVTPNVAYEIKLVVADEDDQQYDTAVFLEAGSFNIGLDLGQDLTIAGGNSACSGETLRLDTLIDPTIGSHTWYKDGVVIPGETDSFIDVLVDGEYSVIVDFTGGCSSTDTIIVEFATSPVLNPIDNQLICDDDNDGFWALDLNTLATQVLGTQDPTEFSVTFHLSQTDADDNTNPLSTPYANATAYTQEEIFIRIESNINTNCFETDSFIFDVADQPTATAQIYDLCDNDDDGDDTNGFLEFDLTTMTPLVLGAQNPAQYNITYHLNQADADVSIGALPLLYTNTTANSQQLIVRIENIDNTDCYETTTIDLIVYELPTVLPFVELFQCDDDTDGFTEFNLTEADEILSANFATEIFTYHITLADAEASINAIVNPTTYTNLDPSATPDIMYVRIETTDGCYRTAQLNLLVSTTQIPPAFQLNYEVCDDDVVDGDYRNGIASFDFSDADATITAIFPPGQTITITYYETLDDALAETNSIVDISNHRNDASPNSQTIFVRVDSDVDNSCLGLGEHITLTVNPLPEENDVSDIEFCSDTPDITSIDLTQFNAEVIGTQNPADFTITYHETQVDADSGANALVSPYTNISNPQIIYVRVEDIATNCFVSSVNFEITVNTNPVISNPTALELCDYDNPGDQTESFTLEDASTEILGGITGVTLTFYESLVDAESGMNAIISPYSNTSNPQTVYARVEDDVTGCYSTTTLDLIVNPLPISNTDPTDLVLCDDNNTGDASEIFDLTINEAYILNGEVGVTATYHESFTAAENGVGVIATPTTYNNTSTPQTIYVRVANDITGCFVVVDFDLIVNPLPDVIAVTDLIECEDNTDGFFDFDLESKTLEVLNGQDPGVFAVTYHTTQADADATINSLTSPYTNTTNPQEIFINITNTITGCDISTVSFFIEIQESSNANPTLMPYIICDNIGDNDGFGQFDLTTRNVEVLNGQDPLIYEVTYYSSFADADLYVNPIPTIYENVTNTQIIYARVDNINTANTYCYAITELTLQVDLLPIFDLDDEYILCIDSNGTEVIGPPLLDTGLSDTDYDFEWSLDGAVIVSATSSSYLALQGGNYDVLVTNIATGCQNTDTTFVLESGPPIVTAILTTVAFAENHVVEATVTGNGVYEFSLDDGPWQESGIFENVPAGEHVVKARDLNGCGIGETTVLVIDYPHYFTPNGDGYNDTWNIVGIGTQANAKIYIFDRYGKLLKQLSPTGDGWNGTFKGTLLPTSDYWFTVEYNEPINGERKLFRAHFTLKR